MSRRKAPPNVRPGDAPRLPVTSGRLSVVDETPTIDTFVPAWLSFREAADQLGVSPNRVRQLVRDRELGALRHASSREPEVPADFLDHGHIVKGLAGTLTLLSDAGYDEEESVRWLFTADDSLPGTPVQALRENRGTEVRRRAQTLGF